jgi:phage terminase small subunit
MPRKRDPKRDEAFETFKKHKGNITNRAIAEELDIPEKTISAWKSRDKWSAALKIDCSTTKKIRSTAKEIKPKQARAPDEEVTLDNFLEGSELTEKQRLFCLYYVKSFNATQAAINAGYSPLSAHVEGNRLLRNAKVAEQIKEIKKDLTNGIFVEAMDVLQKYIKIAFSDMADYLTFGKKMVPVIGAFGPIKDEDDNQVMEEVNYVDFKESSFVDGTIISEVKQGKDGVSIRLEDRMRALDKLAQYFDLFPDKFKRQIEQEKLKLAQDKANKTTDDKPVEIVIKRGVKKDG